MAFDETKYEQGFDWLVEETVHMVQDDYPDDKEEQLVKVEEYLADAMDDMIREAKELMRKSK